jgi:hypothetical protein
MQVPSQDQLMGQLRVIIPALGTIVTAVGVSSISVDHWTGIALAAVGPIAYVASAVWSLFANTQASKIQSVQAIATGPKSATAQSAQSALIDATKAVALDPTIPKSTEAKAALIDAVSAQPEVVGKINVTDQTVVDATQSPQVQKVPQ